MQALVNDPRSLSRDDPEYIKGITPIRAASGLPPLPPATRPRHEFLPMMFRTKPDHHQDAKDFAGRVLPGSELGGETREQHHFGAEVRGCIQAKSWEGGTG